MQVESSDTPMDFATSNCGDSEDKSTDNGMLHVDIGLVASGRIETIISY